MLVGRERDHDQAVGIEGKLYTAKSLRPKATSVHYFLGTVQWTPTSTVYYNARETINRVYDEPNNPTLEAAPKIYTWKHTSRAMPTVTTPWRMRQFSIPI